MAGKYQNRIYKFCRCGLVEGYNLYYSELDSALDAVNDAITRYENEKYEQNGIIGQIQIVINNLENWLDTLGY